MELRVDPKFRDKIPPLTEEEFKQLEDNIVKDGEVYEPIIVWNGTIIDGHNRWKIIQKHPEIPYKVKEMDFPDEWAAFEWMYSKQLGRRNLTETQRTYMLGMMHVARLKSVGGQGGNRYTVLQLDQSDPIVERPKSTAEVIAREQNVSEPTVKRSSKFARGLNALDEVSHEAAQAVLNEKVKVTKKAIRELDDASPERIQQVAQAIQDGEPLPAMTKTPQTLPLTAYLPTQSDSSEREPYNINDLVDEIIENGEDLEYNLRSHINTRIGVVGGNACKSQVANAIGIIIEKLDIFKEEVLNGEFGNG